MEQAFPPWIDTHCHLDDPAFDDIRDETLAGARTAGVGHILNIGYRPERWTTTLALAARSPMVSVSLGIHPGHADEFSAESLDELARLVEVEKPVAIGEIGMDFFWDGPSAESQRDALLKQLELAKRAGLPAIIHQRAAESEILQVFAAAPRLPRLVLHSFDGSAAYVDFALSVNAMVGVGGLATKQGSASLRTLLQTIPVNQIVLETDAPYLIPSGARGRKNIPANIPVIGRRLAPLWGLDEESFARITTTNARRTFGFPGDVKKAG